MLLLYYIYEVGFKFWDTGYAATLTVVLLALLGAVAHRSSSAMPTSRVHYQMIVSEPL